MNNTSTIDALISEIQDKKRIIAEYDYTLTYLIKTWCVDDQDWNPDEKTNRKKAYFLELARKALEGKDG